MKHNLILTIVVFIVSTNVSLAQPKPLAAWDFNDPGNLTTNTVGTSTDAELELIGEVSAIEGIGSGDGAVMIPTGSHYRVRHSIAANGGGSYVNQYSLIIDFRAPSLGSWYSFFQTDAYNDSDGEAFINPDGAIGVGATGYSVVNINENVWYRLVIAVDLAASQLNYYLNGVLIQSSNSQNTDNRFSLYTANHDTPYFLILADNDGEDAEIDVSTFMLFDRQLSAVEVAELHGPLGMEVEGDTAVPSTPMISLGDVKALEDIVIEGTAFFSEGVNSHARTIVTVSLDADFSTVLTSIESSTQLTSITLENSRFAIGMPYYVKVNYISSNGQYSKDSNVVSFTLPAISGITPVFGEDFESTPEGELPAGWSNISFTDEGGTVGFESWHVWELDFLNTFDYYPGYDGHPPSIYDLQTPVVNGKSAHADSAQYGSPYFEAHLFSPEIDLSGYSDVYLTFGSDYLQNQDNIATLEYTLDNGDLSGNGTWQPLLYMLEQDDVRFDADGNINASATFDLDNLADGIYLHYGAYVFAEPVEELAPYIRPLVEENRNENKRFERLRVEMADHQSSVMFRWTFMGTYSWYWGIDHVQVWGNGGSTVSDWSLY